jgi:hypothetical protein
MLTEPLQFDFMLSLMSPLVNLEHASLLLGGCSDQHVTNLIDEGRLRAVNIAVSLETRRNLCVWRHSLERFVRAQAGIWMPKEEPVSPAQIFATVRDPVLKSEAAHLLDCSPRHIERLAEARLIMAGSLSLGSMNRCPRYSRSGLINFLLSREIKL